MTNLCTREGYFLCLLTVLAAIRFTVRREMTSEKVTGSHYKQSRPHSAIFDIKKVKTCDMGYQSEALDVLRRLIP